MTDGDTNDVKDLIKKEEEVKEDVDKLKDDIDKNKE